MSRRYYCDYCDKEFIDDIEARKKHLASTIHFRNRREHYYNCRDLKTILAEEIVKKQCRRWQNTGECIWQAACNFTHYSKEELWQLKLQIDVEEQRKQEEKMNLQIPTIESWLEKYNQKKSVNEKKDSDALNIWWHYPEKLENIPDLPLSLVKFKGEHFKDSNFEEWG